MATSILNHALKLIKQEKGKFRKEELADLLMLFHNITIEDALDYAKRALKEYRRQIK